MLKSLNIRTVFKINNTLNRYILNNKSAIDIKSKSGVYLLACKDCPKFYIGQTGREFYKRIKEHETCYRKGLDISTYATHLLEEGHQFDSDFKILHIENKGYKLNLLETLEINKHKKSQDLLNDQIDINNSPLLNLQLSRLCATPSLPSS